MVEEFKIYSRDDFNISGKGRGRGERVLKGRVQENIYFRQKFHSYYERRFPHFKSAKESNAAHDGSELMLATGSSYWAGIARDTLCLANEAADVAADL